MIRMPSRKLPPSAEPWGRAVDAELASISRTNEKQAQDTNNALSAVNGTLTRLGEQVSEIRTITETLVVQQATLEAQQAQLQEQQSTLSATVAELQTVVSNMLRPVALGDQNYGFTVTPTATVFVRTDFVVPAGYTRAVVFSALSTSAANQNETSSYLYSTVRVNGVVMGSTFDQAKTLEWVQVTTHGARIIYDLAPGATLSITGEAYTTAPGQTWINTSNFAKLSTQVIFLR